MKLTTKHTTKVSKKFLLALALLGSASFVHADVKLVPSDGSELSKLCIAATSTSSRAEMFALAKAAGISRLDLPELRCNGLTLERFAAKYGSARPRRVVTSATPAGYLLRKSDASPLTELCAAAAVSDAEYARVKAMHFSGDATIDAEVLCNGLSLESFVRKYRSGETALVSSR